MATGGHAREPPEEHSTGSLGVDRHLLEAFTYRAVRALMEARDRAAALGEARWCPNISASAPWTSTTASGPLSCAVLGPISATFNR